MPLLPVYRHRWEGTQSSGFANAVAVRDVLSIALQQSFGTPGIRTGTTEYLTGLPPEGPDKGRAGFRKHGKELVDRAGNS